MFFKDIAHCVSKVGKKGFRKSAKPLLSCLYFSAPFLGGSFFFFGGRSMGCT